MTASWISRIQWAIQRLTSNDFASEEFERVQALLQQLAAAANEVDSSEADAVYWIGFAAGMLMQRFDGIEKHAETLLERYAELVDDVMAERN
jgi:hypothetical protein